MNFVGRQNEPLPRKRGPSAGFPLARERTECVPIRPELVSP
jgi:hypothetical protein